MNCDQVTEHIEEYLLGSLEADEALQVAAHIAGCARCTALTGELGAALHSLPLALAARSPFQLPDSLKARVMARAADPATAPGSRSDAQRASVWSRLIAGWKLPAWAAAATVLILAVAVGWNLQLSAALAQERALRSEYASLVDQRELVLDVIDSPRTVKRQLRAVEPGAASYGKLYTRPDLSSVVVMAARLDEPPPGSDYHLWLTLRGETRLAGTIEVNDQGFGLLVFDAGANGPPYDSAKVTLDPVGSSTISRQVLSWDGSQ
jgi:hypothetical protein